MPKGRFEFLLRPGVLEEWMVVQSVVRRYIEPFASICQYSDVRCEAYVRQLVVEVEIDETIEQAVSRVRFHPRNGILETFMDPCIFKILPPQNSAVAKSRAGKELARQCAQLFGRWNVPHKGSAHGCLFFRVQRDPLSPFFLTEECE